MECPDVAKSGNYTRADKTHNRGGGLKMVGLDVPY